MPYMTKIGEQRMLYACSLQIQLEVYEPHISDATVQQSRAADGVAFGCATLAPCFNFSPFRYSEEIFL